MKPIAKIALRRLRKNSRSSIFLMIAILFSMLMISFFVFFELQTLIAQNAIYHDLPFTEFLGKVRMCMTLTIALLLIVTFLTVKTHCSIRNRENEEVLAVLTSVGATARQKRKLVMIEVILLYLPPTLIGICAGVFPGILIGNVFVGVIGIQLSHLLLYTLVAVCMIFLGMLMIVLCCFLPGIRLKRQSVIRSVRKQNDQASEQTHGYRQSKTFKSQSLLKRLAKKSTDYYGKTYHGIALALACAAMYPVTALLLFWHIGNTDIKLDGNPYDGVETTAAVLSAVNKIFLFLVLCFVILTLVGIIQVILMARKQYLTRKQSARVYVSIGIPESDVKRLILLEMSSVLLRSLFYLTVACIIAIACFMLVLG